MSSVTFQLGDSFNEVSLNKHKDAFCIATKKNIVTAQGKCGGRVKEFRCRDCNIFKLRLSRSVVDSLWKVTEVNLEHGNIQDGVKASCIGVCKAKSRYVVNSKQFMVMKDNEKPKSIKGRATIDQLVGAVSNELELEVPPNVLMEANRKRKQKLMESGTDISCVEPYLHAVKTKNPKFHYKVERIEGTDTLERVMMIFPYTKEVLAECYNVLGVDGAHMKNYYVQSGDSEIKLQCKMTLTVFTTRSVGNTMSILCAMFSKTENSKDIGDLIGFCARVIKVSHQHNLKNN